jgi:hypothetical protein
LIGWAELAEHVGQFQLGAGHGAAPLASRQ